MKPLFAQIGCLHTGITLSQDYQNYLDSDSTLIPIEVFIDSARRVWVTKSYDPHTKIELESQVIAINGKPALDILRTLMHAIPADGYNQTEKILLLNHRFAFWYQTMIEAKAAYQIEVRKNGVTKTLELTGVSKQAFPSLESVENNYKKPLEFEVINRVGLLRIHTFAKTVIKKNGQNFKSFTKRTFRKIKAEGIKHLVIDVRYNTGGSDGNAVQLASYFFREPFQYWEKIEVTEALAQEIKGPTKLFFRKPLKDGSMYRWRKARLTNEFDYYLPQRPARNSFAGNVYLLTNGLCLSSCSDFVAILSSNRKALVIGQETGGGFQGNTSGMMPTARIPTGLRVTVPLQKYTNAVDGAKNFGRGTIPDFEIKPSFENWVTRKDVEMEFVLRLIDGK
jgi:C-terminal processing protease CtpA/Prc